MNPIRLETLVPVVMCCAMLWWVSRRMTWTARLLVTAVTLAVILRIMMLTRSPTPLPH